MAGPLDLRGRAIITDGASGPLRAIKGNLDAVGASATKFGMLQNAVATGAAALNKATGAAIGAAAGTAGIMSLLHKAEQFNRNIFGIGVAALADNTKKVMDEFGNEKIVTNFAAVKHVMDDISGTVMRLSKEIGQTPSRLSGIAEVLAKAGFSAEKLEAATRATAQVAANDYETPVSKIGEFASVLDSVYKPRQGEAWADFFKRQLDVIRVAADETRLSVGSTMEGMRAFSALYARMGVSETDNALLLMSGVKMGGESTEVGHTLKSDMVRMLKMTQEAASRFTALGLRREDYTDLANMDPMRAAGNLSRVFRTAGIKGSFRQHIEGEFQKAIEGKYFFDDKFQDGMMDMVARAAGVDMTNEQSRSAFEEKYMNAVTAAGARFDMMKLFRDLIAKGASTADLSTLFEGRRLGTNIQIMEGLKQFGDEFLEKLKMASGQGLDATQKVFDESAFGRLQRFNAMIEQFQIKLANSAGFEAFLNGITRMFDLLGQIPKPITDVATAAGVAAIALAPLALAIKAIGIALAPLRWLLGLGAGAAGGAALARMGLGASVVGAPILTPGAAAAGGAAAGLGARSMLRRGAAMFIPGLGWVMAGASLVGGGYEAYQEYQRGGSAGDIAKSFGWGALTLGMGGSAKAAEGGGKSPLAGPEPGGAWERDGAGDAQGQMQAAVQAAQSASQQILATFQAIDLTAEGQRIGETLAAGLRSGLASAVAAVEEAGAQISAAASRINLNTGPAMQGAR